MDEVGYTEPINEEINEIIPEKLSSIQPLEQENQNVEIGPIEPNNTYAISMKEEYLMWKSQARRNR